LKAPDIHIKSAMKYPRNKNEISIEIPQVFIWKAQWDKLGLRMKYLLKSPKYPYEKHNEISIEIPQVSILKAVGVGVKIKMKYQQLNNENYNESSVGRYENRMKYQQLENEKSQWKQSWRDAFGVSEISDEDRVCADGNANVGSEL